MITRPSIASAIVNGYSAPVYAGKTPYDEIVASKIIDDTLKQRPERQILPMHVAPPSCVNNMITVLSMSRIGKNIDPNGPRFAGGVKSEGEYDNNADRIEVVSPSRTDNGVIIGALAFTCLYDAAVPLSEIENNSQVLGGRVSRTIASLDPLSTPVDSSAP